MRLKREVKKFPPPAKIERMTTGTHLVYIGLMTLLLGGCSSMTKYPERKLAPNPNLQEMQQVPLSTNSISKSSVSHSLSKLDPDPLCGDIYYVKSGDSLSEIAHACNVSMRELATLNDLSPPYVIHKRQALKIPHPPVQPVVSSPEGVRMTKHTTVASHAKPSQQSSLIVPKSTSSVSVQNWLWPAPKALPYRFIRDSSGVSVLEIYGLAGQEVYAVASGQVVYVGEGILEFGKMVVLKHDDEYMSVYAHNSALLVQEGSRVKAGQPIATLGATGNADRPKLYLEARFKGHKVDILTVLSAPD